MAYKGSSPRMRGTQDRKALACRPLGLIPTYAGNTMNMFPSVACAWAHPHVCGEHRIGKL